MASVYRRVRWVTSDGRRVSEAEAARLREDGQSVERREGRIWYLRYVDGSGRRVDQPSRARNKTEARRLAEDLERRAGRVRLGLEAELPADGGGSLAELLVWWLATYRKGQPAFTTEESAIRCHILGTDLAALPLTAVTSGRVEVFLQAKGADLAAQSINHLRGYISRAFNAARKAGKWAGGNPAADVERRRVPRRMPDYLRATEVSPVMAALDVRWRPLFATAIYTGLRKGELLGLRKSDVDFDSGLITVARSYERDTTKGGHADRIPIAAELVSYLRSALAASPPPSSSPRPTDR